MTDEGVHRRRFMRGTGPPGDQAGSEPAGGRALTLRPIGRVATGRPVDDQDGSWERHEAVIEIEPEWADGLEGIEGFSHIWVLWWIDRPTEPCDQLRIHPERREDLPLVGVFATRSPQRPNPIGLTTVRLLERRGRQIRVLGLDAFEGTPVLDIKPYLSRGDMIPDAVMPDWLHLLWRLDDEELRTRETGAAG